MAMYSRNNRAFSNEKFRRFAMAHKILREHKYSISVGGEGVLTYCSNCGNMGRVTEDEQLRSSDEEASPVSWCIMCSDSYVVDVRMQTHT
jgi:DNA-directed RNA polymerase subunit M/transcription elongation factor TFIIS